MRFSTSHWTITVTYHRLPLVVRQGIVYATMGAASMIVDVGLYAALTRLAHVQYLAANVISFIVSASANFLANRRYTFSRRGKPQVSQYTLFLTIAAVGLFLNTAILGTLVSIFRIHDILAKILAAAVVFFWNFGMNRTFTFRAR